jgi:hypothetical protein
LGDLGLDGKLREPSGHTERPHGAAGGGPAQAAGGDEFDDLDPDAVAEWEAQFADLPPLDPDLERQFAEERAELERPLQSKIES